MIVFARVPEPSSLLLAGDLNRVARMLLAQCNDGSVLERPGAVDSLWQQAQSLDRQGNTEGFAIVSIRLAELFRGCGRLGPALKCAEKAKDILSRWPHKHQKQNLAVSLYACGLVHQLLGSYREACESYDEALAVFADARRQRRSLNVPHDFEAQCQKAEGAIEDLSTYVARAATCGNWGGVQFCGLMGCWLAEGEPREAVQPVMSVAVKEVVIGMELQLGAQNYRLEALSDGPDLRLSLPSVEGYLLVEVPENLAQALGKTKAGTELQDAKYVLVESGIRSDLLGVGIRRAEGEGLVWGEFVRDPDSSEIRFTASYEGEPLRPPKFVGDDDLRPGSMGTVVGVFR